MPRRKEPSGWWDRPDRPKPQSRRNVGPGKQYSSFEEFEKDLSKRYDEVDAKAKEHRDNEMATIAMDEKKHAVRTKNGVLKSLARSLSRKLTGNALNQDKAAGSTSGPSASEMRAAGAYVADLVEANIAWREIFAAGYGQRQLTEGGFSLEALQVAGCKEHGITAGLLRQAGFPASALLNAGFSSDGLLRAGYGLCPKGGGECKHVMKGDDGNGHPTHTVCSKCGAMHRA